MPQNLINSLIPHKEIQNTSGQGTAPVNIALSKYWGKRDIPLNLPTNSSLSISLPELGTKTTIQLLDAAQDKVILNNKEQDPTSIFATRLSKYLDFFRPANQSFLIETTNTVPTAAGLASSASGYAALVLALDDLYGWQLDKKQLSILARLGSGSASRSIYEGFAIWHKGEKAEGTDSYAEALDHPYPDLRIGLVKVDVSEKSHSSTQGMQHTVNTCHLYQNWPAQAEAQLQEIKQAIIQQDFSKLGATAEHNALSMHATMIASWPPILYWQAESITAMQKVWQLRETGTEVYFTMDAGPNLKLLYLQADSQKIKQAFPAIQELAPFQ